MRREIERSCGAPAAGDPGLSPIVLTPEIWLEVSRCYTCGRYWAQEQGCSGSCPVCAARQIDGWRRRNKRHDHQVAALKGALTKAKAKR